MFNDDCIDWMNCKEKLKLLLERISEKYFNGKGVIVENIDREEIEFIKTDFPEPNMVLKVKNGVCTKRVGICLIDGFYNIIFDFDNLHYSSETYVPFYLLENTLNLLVEGVFELMRDSSKP